MMSKQTTRRHWAYSLPDLIGRKTPYWAREAVAEHAHPEHWALMWGWCFSAIKQAKAAAEKPDAR